MKRASGGKWGGIAGAIAAAGIGLVIMQNRAGAQDGTAPTTASATSQRGVPEKPPAEAADAPVRIEVRPQGKQNWSDRAAIVAGRMDSQTHRADVRITVRDPAAKTVPVTLTGGIGHGENGGAVLMFGTIAIHPGKGQDVPLQAGGTAEGVLISSNLENSATISSGEAKATVEFDWDNSSGGWQKTPDFIAEGIHLQQHVVTLSRDGVPIQGHAIGIYLEDQDYVDEQGNKVTVIDHADCPQSLVDFGSYPNVQVTTDNEGKAHIDYFVISGGEFTSSRMYDFSVFDAP